MILFRIVSVTARADNLKRLKSEAIQDDEMRGPITAHDSILIREITLFAHNLGVAAIRLVSAAQQDRLVPGLQEIPRELVGCHPILKYRVQHFLAGRNVRGIEEYDCHRCYLAMDDSAVAGDWHFPCVIYLREGGKPIGRVGDGMRQERAGWSRSVDTFADPICRKNCLDVCIDFNNRCAVFAGGHSHD